MDYQKSLNQQIFEREDTALQRRMADAKAAGVNPYAVLGQAAGSGGKVSAPVAPQMKSGILDAINTGMSVYSNLVQTQKQKVDMENSVKSGLILDADLAQKLSQNKILGYEVDNAQLQFNQNILDQLSYLYDFNSYYGTNFRFKKDNVGDSIYSDYSIWDDKNKIPDVFKYSLDGTNLADYDYKRNWWTIPNRQIDLLEEQVQQSKYNTEMMRKQNEWYNWNQGLNFGTSILDSALGFLNFGQKKTMDSLNFGLQSNRNSFEQYKYFDRKNHPGTKYYY